MSRSFFTGTDHEVLTGSAAFTARITQDPSAYGISEAQLAQYAALDAAYAQAYQAANSPATRTRSAVIAKRDAKAALRAMASDLNRIIAGTESVSDVERISLGLSVRDKPSPMGPPGKPESISVSLSAIGSLELRWTCRNPVGSTGTMYHVFRRVGPGGPFVYLDSVGKKRFADLTVPRGASQITYRIQAVRSTKAGPVALFEVNFGSIRQPAAAQTTQMPPQPTPALAA